MRWPEIAGGFKVYVSNEENQLLDKIREQEGLFKKDLTTREKELANKMVSRGVLKRVEIGERLAFKYNGLERSFQ